ncbi:hypothetical protein LCGC14_2752120 [marine sediment metagenome]|uniref:Uncharacterized protein n=1 Tax=marine sediment metagenome TaxID=412755 RepID=A0A0F8ZNH1_9ZZZZ
MLEHEPTVFIVDDDGVLCDGISQLVETVGLKAKVFSSAQEFLDSYDTARHGCLVLDIRMPGISGLQLQEKLAESDIEFPIIFITGYGSVRMGVDAVKKGAIDFIEKPFEDQYLLDQINNAIAKDAKDRKNLFERQAIEAKLALLTPRERQVLSLIKDEKNSKAIALKLGLSQKTVEGHRAHIMEKMQVETIAGLVARVNKVSDA